MTCCKCLKCLIQPFIINRQDYSRVNLCITTKNELNRFKRIEPDTILSSIFKLTNLSNFLGGQITFYLYYLALHRFLSSQCT